VERRFFALAWRQHGPGLALFAWPALQATHASIGLGFGLGLLRVVRRGLAKDVEGNP
jgi:hypothetical protein